MAGHRGRPGGRAHLPRPLDVRALSAGCQSKGCSSQRKTVPSCQPACAISTAFSQRSALPRGVNSPRGSWRARPSLLDRAGHHGARDGSGLRPGCWSGDLRVPRGSRSVGPLDPHSGGRFRERPCTHPVRQGPALGGRLVDPSARARTPRRSPWRSPRNCGGSRDGPKAAWISLRRTSCPSNRFGTSGAAVREEEVEDRTGRAGKCGRTGPGGRRRRRRDFPRACRRQTHPLLRVDHGRLGVLRLLGRAYEALRCANQRRPHQVHPHGPNLVGIVRPKQSCSGRWWGPC